MVAQASLDLLLYNFKDFITKNAKIINNSFEKCTTLEAMLQLKRGKSRERALIACKMTFRQTRHSLPLMNLYKFLINILLLNNFLIIKYVCGLPVSLLYYTLLAVNV